MTGKRLDLCSPEVYTFREMIEILVRTTGHRCFIVGLSDLLARLQGGTRCAANDLDVGQLLVFAGRQSPQGEWLPGARNESAVS